MLNAYGKCGTKSFSLPQTALYFKRFGFGCGKVKAVPIIQTFGFGLMQKWWQCKAVQGGVMVLGVNAPTFDEAEWRANEHLLF